MAIKYGYDDGDGCLGIAGAMVGAIVFMLLLFYLYGCDLYVTDSYYLCVVDGDTIHLPGDTTGIRCADVDSLPRL